MHGLTNRQLGRVAAVSGLAALGGVAGVKVYRRRRTAVRQVREIGHGGEVRTVTTADGTKLHVEIDGPATAPLTVLFTHGYFMELTTWRYQRDALLDWGVRLAFYDHRGYGKSERGPKGIASIRLLAADLYDVIEAVAPTGPVVVVGHSMGSFTIQALAGIHPELFGDRIVASVLVGTAAQGSVLMNTLLHEFPFAQRLLSPAASVLDVAARLRPYLVRAFGLGMYRPFAFVFVDRMSSARARREFLAVISSAHLDVMSEYLMTLAAHEEFASLPTLGKARCVIVSGAHDMVVPVSLSAAAAAEIPGAEHVIIPDTGHIVPFEQAEVLNDVLADVIDNALPTSARYSIN